MSEQPILPAYSDGDIDTNHTNAPTLMEIVGEAWSRRQTMMGGLGATAAAFLGTSLLAACGDDSSSSGASSITVSVGANSVAGAGSIVTLTGSAAGVSSTGSWAQTSGPAVTFLTNGNTATFQAPGVAAPTPLVFRFSVPGVGSSTFEDATTVTVNPATLAFAAVAKNLNDVVTVPAGYTVGVLTRLGDPIATGVGAYANDGSDTNFAQRIGDHGDALYYFGLGTTGAREDASSVRGILAQNHENISEAYLHTAGPSAAPRPEAEVLKEIECHGVSFVEVKDNGSRAWAYVQNSPFNRRITPHSPMQFNGPVRGSDFLKTVHSPAGVDGRGTINNCANGVTGWATLLTCEENWAGYFRRDNSGAGTDNAARTARELVGLRRYGVTSNTGNYSWSSAPTTDSRIKRFDARATGASATADYRNEPNQFGWVVEIDPYNPAALPRKRTALGRMGHEGAWFGKLTAGKKVAVYMGDDARREYLYKFVSAASWTEADGFSADRLAMGDKYLDNGTLYVAKFNADGTGTWLPLVFGSVPDRAATGGDPVYSFTSQADILVNTRLAADAVGATPMDRPEWTAVNPVTGEVYLTLTNNNAAGRPLTGTDAANPRHYNDPRGAANTAQFGNPNGHIIRLRETADDTAATTFGWDIYLFGADSAQADAANINLSGLTADNDFSSPDGLWFGRAQNPTGQGKPVLWIQTDDGALTDRTNCMMLAALPGTVGDGSAKTITNTGTGGATATQATRPGAAATGASLKRFLVGPKECEITGVDTTPDGRTLFVGIQHPGEGGNATAPTSNWPASQTGGTSGRPRSAVVFVTKTDGGIVGI